jgi:hypothetical protein
MAKLTMKSIIKAAAATAVLSGIAIVFGCAIPKTHRSLIVNNTGATITQIYIRDAGEANWGTHVNREIRTTEEFATCRQCGSSGCYEVSCTKTVHVRDQYGNYVYDTKNLVNGDSYNYSFRVPKTAEGETPQLKSIDVKLVDANGIIYGKNNVNLAQVGSIVITQSDMYPILTVQNNTGFPISITSPSTEDIGNENSAMVYQMPELKDDRAHIVSYSIGGYSFNKEVTLNNHTTINLTDRPPTITVKNNTGFPITITSPFNQMVANGASSDKYPKNSRNANPKHIVSYNSGYVEFKKEAMLDNEDVVITLTEKDRAPIVTVLNNTGNTVNLVFLRNPGSNWPEQNILSIKLKEDGMIDTTNIATQAGERRGSFTNKETFRFWLGNLRVKLGKYDIRIDDIKNESYVKNGVEIIEDMTLTFTPKDKR